MSLPDPKLIQTELSEVFEILGSSQGDLPQAQRAELLDKLAPVLNYVSFQTSKPGLINTLHVQSARDARAREQLASDQQSLEAHKAFVATSFDNAEKHFKTIQLAGYAVFFAIWGFTREWLPPTAEAFAAILMTISAVFFVCWEIAKTSILAAVLRRHAKASSQSLDRFLLARSSEFSSKCRAISFFSRARAWVWWLCLIPALGGVGIMVSSFVVHLVQLLWCKA